MMATRRALPAAGGNNFDFLRFVLASLVVLSHSYPLATGNEEREPLALLTRHQLTFGALAVDCFFVISGFLISQSWVARPEAVAFLKKRVRRIYPGFIVAATIGAFVIVPVFSTAPVSVLSAGFILSFVGDALRLLAIEPGPAFQGNPAPGVVNGSLWSIPYEFWCYIGVLVCGLAGVLRRPTVLWTAVVGSIALSVIFAVFELTPGGRWLGQVFGYPPFWARLLPYFLAGMAFHASRHAIPLNAVGAATSLALVALAARIPHGLAVAMPMTAAYLLLWFAQLRMPLLRRFGKHGDFSYGVYLYSFPILQIVVHVQGGGPMHPLLLFAAAWPCSIGAAVLSWHFVERRFIAPRRPDRRHGQTAPAVDALDLAPR